MTCTLSEITEREYRTLQEFGLTEMQIAFANMYRRSLRHYGRGHNPLATPDVLRNRHIDYQTHLSSSSC